MAAAACQGGSFNKEMREVNPAVVGRSVHPRGSGRLIQGNDDKLLLGLPPSALWAHKSPFSTLKSVGSIRSREHTHFFRIIATTEAAKTNISELN